MDDDENLNESEDDDDGISVGGKSAQLERSFNLGNNNK